MPDISRLFVVLGLKNDDFSKGLNSADKQLKKFGLSINKIALGATAAGGVIVAGAVASVKAWAQAGDEIAKLAKKTGFSTEALSELKYAAELSGANISDLQMATRTLNSAIVDASEGLTTYQRALERIGLKYGDLKGLNPEEQFMTVALRLSDLTDQTELSATAQDLFGRSAQNLLPLLAEGSDGINKLREEAHRLGIVFSDEMATAAERFNDNISRMQKAVDGLKYGLAEELAPTLEKVTNLIVGMLSVDKEAAGGLGKGILGAGGGLLGLGGLLTSLKFLGAPLTGILAGGGMIAGGVGYIQLQKTLAESLSTMPQGTPDEMRAKLEVYRLLESMQGKRAWGDEKFAQAMQGAANLRETAAMYPEGETRRMYEEQARAVEARYTDEMKILETQKAWESWASQAEDYLQKQEAYEKSLKDYNQALGDSKIAEDRRKAALEQEQAALNKLNIQEQERINLFAEAARSMAEVLQMQRWSDAMKANAFIGSNAEWEANRDWSFSPDAAAQRAERREAALKGLNPWEVGAASQAQINIYLDGEQVQGAIDRRMGDALSSKSHMGG